MQTPPKTTPPPPLRVALSSARLLAMTYAPRPSVKLPPSETLENGGF